MRNKKVKLKILSYNGERVYICKCLEEALTMINENNSIATVMNDIVCWILVLFIVSLASLPWNMLQSMQ